MTPKQIELVQQSWAQVRMVGDTAARMFYHRLFRMEPSIRSMFRGGMQAQGRKLVNMIGFAVQGLTRLDAIVPGLRALGLRHAVYGVEERHYALVGSALIWTLEQGLGEEFTEEVKEAWATA